MLSRLQDLCDASDHNAGTRHPSRGHTEILWAQTCSALPALSSQADPCWPSSSLAQDRWMRAPPAHTMRLSAPVMSCSLGGCVSELVRHRLTHRRSAPHGDCSNSSYRCGEKPRVCNPEGSCRFIPMYACRGNKHILSPPCSEAWGSVCVRKPHLVAPLRPSRVDMIPFRIN